MAIIFKRKKNPGKNWLIKYKDEFGRWRTVAGTTDKETTKDQATLLERRVICRKNGVVNEFEAPEAVALSEHVAAYERYLKSKGNSPAYIKQAVKQVEAVFDACDFKGINDLRAHDATDKVRKHLSTLRGGENPISNETSNRYQTAIKGFVNWAHSENKMPHSPLADLPKLATEIARPRRAATAKQFKALIKAAKGGPETHDLTGEQRAMLYQVAAHTGLRASELASLTPESFKLGGDQPHVVIRAAKTKNRKDTQQPISADLVKLVKPWLATQTAKQPLWPGRWYQRAAEMLRVDLKPAKIAPETEDGVFDFHALRTTYVTNLARGDVHPRIAQELARHSDIKLTMKHYTKFDRREVAAGLSKLPKLSG